MTPSQEAKAAGLKSLAQLAEIAGESQQNLINWHKNYPRRFELLVLGAKVKLNL